MPTVKKVPQGVPTTTQKHNVSGYSWLQHRGIKMTSINGKKDRHDLETKYVVESSKLLTCVVWGGKKEDTSQCLPLGHDLNPEPPHLRQGQRDGRPGSGNNKKHICFQGGKKSIMCSDVKLIPHWILLRSVEAYSLCGPEVNSVLCYSV